MALIDMLTAEHPRAVAIRQHARRLIAFGGVSAVGLAIDLLLFAMLVHGGRSPTLASRLSSTVAIGFVFFASVRRVFFYRGQFALPLFGVYLCYQALSVLVSAAGVGKIAALGLEPLVAKLVILPLTFPANYAAMSLITSLRGRNA